ncbi:transporter substrate-binding domain-containing protein [Chitinibacter sp. SCUT-21]|uniref:substrate-binding periplasmic protein n=1 Tax=Chitinibacter sp. SCUT-21 TaxID=2970891 RepID=UPI0035A6105F
MRLKTSRLFTLLFALFLLPAVWAKSGGITITLANGEWPPLQGQQLPDFGPASQVVTRALALRGIRVRYEFMPWRRALEESRKGNFAGTLLWSLNDDRKQHFWFSDAVYRSKTVLFYHHAKPVFWKNLPDLAGKKMGVTNGYSYGDEWEKLQREQVFLTDIGNTDEQNLAKLLSQRIDGFPCELLVCQHLIATHFPPITQKILLFQPRPVHSETMHVLFSKNRSNGQWLAEQFNLGLQELKRSGELRRLLPGLDH